MRIAIVDNIASEREPLKDRVAMQAARLSRGATVSCYASGADRKKYVTRQTFREFAAALQNPQIWLSVTISMKGGA